MALPGVEKAHLSTFERLPAEIRNNIISFAVVRDHHLDISMAKRQPALAATNSNIRKQTLAIFYGANTFLMKACGNSASYIGGTATKVLHEYAPYLEMMRRVGAYCRARNSSMTYSKLFTHLKHDQAIEVQFTSAEQVQLACACRLMYVSSKQEGFGTGTYAGDVLYACIVALERLMDPNLSRHPCLMCGGFRNDIEFGERNPG